jgi:chaperone required for assembly of F1-ATPase
MRRRRWWTTVSVVQAGPAFAVQLDGCAAETPGGASLVLPSRPLAEAVAAEWVAVEAEPRPEAMALTRLAVAALDQVAPAPDPLRATLAAYGESDLLCYRAETPDALRRRQDEAWDPLLAWAAETLGAPLAPVAGIVHRPQPAESLAALRAAVDREGAEPVRLAGLAELVFLSGSLVLGLAVARGHLAAAEAWPLSRIDEDWQAERWGEDAEAAAAARQRRTDFLVAERVVLLARR